MATAARTSCPQTGHGSPTASRSARRWAAKCWRACSWPPSASASTSTARCLAVAASAASAAASLLRCTARSTSRPASSRSWWAAAAARSASRAGSRRPAPRPPRLQPWPRSIRRRSPPRLAASSSSAPSDRAVDGTTTSASAARSWHRWATSCWAFVSSASRLARRGAASSSSASSAASCATRSRPAATASGDRPVEPVELLVGQAHRRLGCGGATVGLLSDPLVDAEVEQGDQELLAVGGTVVQEAGELALGQDDATDEVAERQAEHLLDGRRHLLGPPGQHPPVGRLQPSLLRGDPAVSIPPDDPGGLVTPAGDLEGEPHPRLLMADRHGRADKALVAVAGHAAVEREADGVDHGRLARAGGPDEGEEVGVVEVDVGALPNAPKPSSTSRTGRISRCSATARRRAGRRTGGRGEGRRSPAR